jgi:hypothetical protein
MLVAASTGLVVDGTGGVALVLADKVALVLADGVFVPVGGFPANQISPAMNKPAPARVNRKVHAVFLGAG